MWRWREIFPGSSPMRTMTSTFGPAMVFTSVLVIEEGCGGAGAAGSGSMVTTTGIFHSSCSRRTRRSWPFTSSTKLTILARASRSSQ